MQIRRLTVILMMIGTWERFMGAVYSSEAGLKKKKKDESQNNLKAEVETFFDFCEA